MCGEFLGNTWTLTKCSPLVSTLLIQYNTIILKVHPMCNDRPQTHAFTVYFSEMHTNILLIIIPSFECSSTTFMKFSEVVPIFFNVFVTEPILQLSL